MYSITSMEDSLTQFNPPHNHPPRTDWQMLGRLKLGAASNPNRAIKGWLMDALRDYSLSDDLMSRLVASIEETTMRILSPDSINGQLEFLEIAVLGPSGQDSQRHTWGFFRLERATVDSQIESSKGYSVEYYLYVDKAMGKSVQSY